jgi:c-di-GMP-related signal transduction protein
MTPGPIPKCLKAEDGFKIFQGRFGAKLRVIEKRKHHTKVMVLFTKGANGHKG